MKAPEGNWVTTRLRNERKTKSCGLIPSFLKETGKKGRGPFGQLTSQTQKRSGRTGRRISLLLGKAEEKSAARRCTKKKRERYFSLGRGRRGNGGREM